MTASEFLLIFLGFVLVMILHKNHDNTTTYTQDQD